MLLSNCGLDNEIHNTLESNQTMSFIVVWFSGNNGPNLQGGGTLYVVYII